MFFLYNSEKDWFYSINKGPEVQTSIKVRSESHERKSSLRLSLLTSNKECLATEWATLSHSRKVWVKEHTWNWDASLIQSKTIESQSLLYVLLQEGSWTTCWASPSTIIRGKFHSMAFCNVWRKPLASTMRLWRRPKKDYMAVPTTRPSQLRATKPMPQIFDFLFFTFSSSITDCIMHIPLNHTPPVAI